MYIEQELTDTISQKLTCPFSKGVTSQRQAINYYHSMYIFMPYYYVEHWDLHLLVNCIASPPLIMYHIVTVKELTSVSLQASRLVGQNCTQFVEFVSLPALVLFAKLESINHKMSMIW